MKKLVVILVVSMVVTFISCDKVESITESSGQGYSTSRTGPDGIEIVDSVYGYFSEGHNEVDGYIIDIHPDFDPIETAVYLTDKVLMMQYLTVGDMELKFCPKKGKTCGRVYYLADEPDAIWEFVGYY